ncbi:stimulated by retinoic acid gene 6 protein-like isoform X2 [Ambystoma mexicanum]|uniref:stimulated by retinoic acid gene 6 protein-like isoform X2 n=1 Tax=Ambystoma mexicanum TaxID=8296 RepID=UPI0037E81412
MNMPLESSNATGGSSAEGCKDMIRMDLFVHFSLIPAVLITLLLSYLQRRAKHRHIDDNLPLDQRFGIIEPANFGSSSRNRWSYGAACGAAATTVFLLFIKGYSSYFPFTTPVWANVFVYLLSALEAGVDYYPFFACLSTRHKIIGSVLGFCYALSWFCVQVVYIFDCQINENTHFSKLIPLPSLICCLFLMGHFIQIFAKHLKGYCRAEFIDEEEPFLPRHQYNYVKNLLKARTDEATVAKSCFAKRIYQWDPNFRFPLRMIVTSLLCLICLYNFILVDFYISPKAVMRLDHIILEAVNKTLADKTKRSLLILKESWFYSTFPAIAVSVTYIFHVMACYRTQIKSLFRGEKKYMPLKRPPAVLAASIRYTGYQIAFLLWGYLVLRILCFLVSVIIAFVFVVPIQDGNGMQLLEGIGYALLGAVLMATVIIVQVLASQFFFLQDKLYPTDQTKPLAINNRRAFQNFSYFFLFYSAMLGFGNCVLRLIINVFLGSWLFARIDRPLFPRGYESIDMGYCTWVGMLRVDFYHTHPVAVAFCHLLIQESEMNKTQAQTAESPPPDVLEACQGKKFRTKWWLMYTLQNNPRLIMDRKQRGSAVGTFPMGTEDLESLMISTVRSRKLQIKETGVPDPVQSKGSEDRST